MRRIIQNLLREFGYNDADQAEDGIAALKLLRNTQYDFVISDWNMPNLNGIELLTAIRSDDKLKHIPVLMVTAECTKENVLVAAKAGANGYILKPFTSQTLNEKITKIIDRL